jgi:ketosteroid isomerase-like protein
MPEDHVALARELFDAITRRDLERLIELTDAQVAWRSFFALGEEGGEYHGHAGLRRYVDDLDDAWDVLEPALDGAVAAGEVVVIVGRVRYRGKLGVEAEEKAGWVLKFHAAKLLWFRAFSDPERLFESIAAPDA